MPSKKSLSIHTATLLLASGLGLAACSDSVQTQNAPAPSSTEKVGEQNTQKPVQANTHVAENAQPFWKKIPHTEADEAIFENLGKVTQFFINTNSIEQNAGNANWRNAVAAVNIIPAADEAESTKPKSLMLRYTVDCTNSLVLPLDMYLFDQNQAQGQLLSEQELAMGPVKLEAQDSSFYNEMKNEVCTIATTTPLDLLVTPSPEWLLIHEPQPPQANPFFAYIDKKSIHPSIEYSPWKRATMLTQPNELNASAIADGENTEPASQLWQVSVDCTRQKFRFDFVAAMENLQGQGQVMQIGLSDKGFETPKEKSEKKLVELVCNAN